MEACCRPTMVKLPVHGLPLHPAEEDTIRPVPSWIIKLTASGDPDMLLADAVMRVLSPSSTCPRLDWRVTINIAVSSPVLVHTGCSPDRSLGSGVGGICVGIAAVAVEPESLCVGAMDSVGSLAEVGIVGNWPAEGSHATSANVNNKHDTASVLSHIDLNIPDHQSERTIVSLMSRIIR